MSVGFLIRDTGQVKTLAPNLGNVDCDDDVQANGLISIPTRAVIRVVPMREINKSLSAACNGRRRPTSAPAVVSKRPAAGTRRKRPTP